MIKFAPQIVDLIMSVLIGGPVSLLTIRLFGVDANSGIANFFGTIVLIAGLSFAAWYFAVPTINIYLNLDGLERAAEVLRTPAPTPPPVIIDNTVEQATMRDGCLYRADGTLVEGFDVDRCG